MSAAWFGAAAKAKRDSMLHQMPCIEMDGYEEDCNPGQPPRRPIERSNLRDGQEREEPQEEVNDQQYLHDHPSLLIYRLIIRMGSPYPQYLDLNP